MTLKQVNWAEFLFAAEPPLPYDVTFRVFSLQDETQFEEISAHKLLLASVSEVFHTQFYGSLADEQKVIEIKDTTLYAFKECLQRTMFFTPLFLLKNLGRFIIRKILRNLYINL